MDVRGCDEGRCGCRGAGSGAGEAAAGGAPGTAERRAAGNGGGPSGPSRRDFLKLMGLTGAGAAAVGCAPPDTADKLIPYLVEPEDIHPGANTIFATALTGGMEPVGVHAWTRDGRVIMLEGNPDFPTNEGSLGALDYSELQALYDPDRVRGPRRNAGGGLREAAWEEALEAAGQGLAEEEVVLLTDALTGTRDAFYGEWAEAVGARHLRFESLAHSAQRRAHEIVFGRDEFPLYALERADRIVSFGADFLGTWLAPVEMAGRFARAREIEEGRHAKTTWVGPRLNLTGASADEWLPARPGRAGLVALAVASAVAEIRGGEEAAELRQLLVPYSPRWAADRTGVPAGRIQNLAEELAAAERPVALPPGPEDGDERALDAHVAVALLNYVMGAVGETVRFGVGPLRSASATLEEMRELIRDMEEGRVGTLVVAGTNPLHTLPASAGFAAALEGVPRVVSLSPHLDETTAAAHWILPSHHELEAWGDAEVRSGGWALAQPVMRPVFDTRAREDILLELAGQAGADPAETFGASDFSTYLQDAWRDRWEAAGAPGRFQEWWDESLRRGGRYEDVRAAEEDPDPVQLAAGAAEYDFRSPEAADPDAFDLAVYPTAYLHDGRGANRGWMQELPDPMTQVVWNSWVEMHPETAEPLGLRNGDVVEVRSGEGTVRAPVYLYRGIRPDAVAIPLGQGHTEYGRNARDRGVDPLDLIPDRIDPRSGVLALAGTRVEVVATGERERLVNVQGHDHDLDREISELMHVNEAERAIDVHEIDLAEVLKEAWDSDPKSPYRWGMTVDLNACTGCGACVTACYAENNLPVVGEEECARGREMSWLRIGRWYEETADGFETVHVPMLCQQCGDAPCEAVCPVYATYHNGEGLNVQVYNRCVGTRYCANNCPYKVRRFNWFTHDFPYPLNLQLNPDVTVREKGVMEKCTFCVQRIQRAKVEAKEEGRLVHDGEVRTACQSACPTRAISFGNLKDPTSEVSQIAKGARSYHVLSELSTRPAVTYLKDVTHDEPVEGPPPVGPWGPGTERGRG